MTPSTQYDASNHNPLLAIISDISTGKYQYPTLTLPSLLEHFTRRQADQLETMIHEAWKRQQSNYIFSESTSTIEPPTSFRNIITMRAFETLTPHERVELEKEIDFEWMIKSEHQQKEIRERYGTLDIKR